MDAWKPTGPYEYLPQCVFSFEGVNKFTSLDVDNLDTTVLLDHLYEVDNSHKLVSNVLEVDVNPSNGFSFAYFFFFLNQLPFLFFENVRHGTKLEVF